MTAFHDAVVEEVFGAAGRRSILGDKTPDYGYYMVLLQRLWPEARFIHVVRNGVDTARSMARHRGSQLMVSAGYDNWCALSYDHLYRRYRRRRLPLAAYVASWRRRLDRIREEAAALPGAYREVRYEDLVDDPAATLGDVAEFLGLGDEASWIGAAARRPARRARTQEDPRLFARLTAPDLRALAAVGGVAYLLLPARAGADELRAAIAEGRQAEDRGDHAHAIRVGLSVLATELARRDGRLRSAAGELVQRGLAGAGRRREAEQWAAELARRGCP